jgi:golgi apyrase
MRLLTTEEQDRVLASACDYLRSHSNFRLDSASNQGPCGSSVRIISGEEEGLFGWIAVNYLMDGFSASDNLSTTYGFLDMGGASTQIAFEPNEEERRKHDSGLAEVRLRRLNGEEIKHQVFVTTWLGYGTNQARQRYVDRIIGEHDDAASQSSNLDTEFVLDPCLPKDLQLNDQSTSLISSGPSRKLLGTGSFEQCLLHTAPLLNKDAPCTDLPCLFNGVHVPTIDFSASHFIGISEYWYSSEHVFGLGGAYDYVQYEHAASEFCSRPWMDILRQHATLKAEGQPRLGGDGEVVEDGRVVEMGKWGSDVEIPRLQMQCFKAAWIANVLHEGIGIPRIVDPGGDGTLAGDSQGTELAEQASRKGLGRPSFQSMDSVGDIAISWTLGKIVLEASKEVPVPKGWLNKPLEDPHEDRWSLHAPFFDFSPIEDRISHHLPASLSRTSLGFSLVGLLFYMLVFATLAFVSFRMRSNLRSALRRVRRRLTSRMDRVTIAEEFSMEEGRLFDASSPSVWQRSFSSMNHGVHRVVSMMSHNKTSPKPSSFHNGGLATSQSLKPLGREQQSRTPQMRSFSLSAVGNSSGLSSSRSHHPTINIPLSNKSSTTTTTASSSQYNSRPSSPAIASKNFFDDEFKGRIVAGTTGGLSTFSARSRNASQISLTGTASNITGSDGLLVANSWTARASTISRASSIKSVSFGEGDD